MPLPITAAGMNMPQALAAAPAEAPIAAAAPRPGPSFEGLLLESLSQVDQLDQASQSAIAGALAGGDLTQAEVLVSVKKADLAFRTMLQIRNKLVEAYNELKNLRM
jgi:flagellar hook-basal body complex protein FliE